MLLVTALAHIRSRAEVKNVWSYTSTPTFSGMMLCKAQDASS